MNYKAIVERVAQEHAAKIANPPNQCPVCGEGKAPSETICPSCRRRESETMKDITEGRR